MKYLKLGCDVCERTLKWDEIKHLPIALTAKIFPAENGDAVLREPNRIFMGRDLIETAVAVGWKENEGMCPACIPKVRNPKSFYSELVENQYATAPETLKIVFDAGRASVQLEAKRLKQYRYDIVSQAHFNLFDKEPDTKGDL